MHWDVLLNVVGSFEIKPEQTGIFIAEVSSESLRFQGAATQPY
jgi:hypothetical protein